MYSSLRKMPHRYGKLTCHMGSHSVTCHSTEVRIPPLPPAEAGTWFSDPGGMQGWVDLCYVKADQPGIEPRPVSRKSDALLSIASPTPYCWATMQLQSLIMACIRRYHLVLNNHFETAAADGNAPDCSASHYVVSHQKIRLLSKLFDHFLEIRFVIANIISCLAIVSVFVIALFIYRLNLWCWVWR